ncbi:wax ester/triacylglycerol synthase family O-acyltransferase [Kocuria sp. CPCC 205292]|uniref:wax ester/triacylglycerol synthase domain-containing protein n=1 Tax=Kocuria cellulosilytica TaxID=3071451 RepID=UPI0034D6634B
MSHQRRRVRPGQRISALDEANLRVERHGVPMHAAALALLEPAPLLGPAGQVRLDTVREHVERRTRDVRRLRQVLARPGGGRPVWLDDPVFDVSRHVRSRPVPPPGDEEALLRVGAGIDATPLPRDRPLWELWLLPGLAEGRLGLLIRWHHVLADGLAALNLLAPLFDPAAVPGGGTGAPGGPGGPGGPGAPARGRADGGPARAPVRAAARLRGRAAQLRGALAEGRAPALSINRPVGPRRGAALVRADLEAVRELAHRHGGTVNDVVLTAVAGGARRLLAARGELAGVPELKVSVVASVRGPGDPVGGNRTGVRVVAVPVDEPDPAARLRRIAATTAAQRARPPYRPGGRLAQRWTVRVMDRQRLVNLLLSNVRGPSAPLRFAGAPVRELFQLGAVQGNLALAVGVVSYAGALGVDVVADADVVPDLPVFVEGLAETLERLGAGPPPGAGTGP